MKKTKIALLYGFFALTSIFANMFSQFLFFSIYAGKYYIYIGLFIGTFVGLVVKYVLDKKWIFFYVTKSKLKDFQTFLLYSSMGIVTTLIFWGFELGFYFLFLEWELAKYIGGLIGLFIGYTIKYFLDKRFVFK